MAETKVYLVVTEEYYGGSGDEKHYRNVFLTLGEAQAHKAKIEREANLDVIIDEYTFGLGDQKTVRAVD